MMTSRIGELVILMAVVLHYAWSVLLMGYGTHIHSTPLAYFCESLTPQNTGYLLSIVATLAVLGLYLNGELQPWQKALFMIPQQAVLAISAGTSISAVLGQQYADGIIRHWAFILSDQLPLILLAIFHTAAVLMVLTAQWRLSIASDHMLGEN